MAPTVLDKNPRINHILTTLRDALHEGERSGPGHVHLPPEIPIRADGTTGKFFAVFAAETELGKIKIA